MVALQVALVVPMQAMLTTQTHVIVNFCIYIATATQGNPYGCDSRGHVEDP